ncbi:hypothetical protein SLE2022_237560 [Rubroshorea leprosula]
MSLLLRSIKLENNETSFQRCYKAQGAASATSIPLPPVARHRQYRRQYRRRISKRLVPRKEDSNPCRY